MKDGIYRHITWTMTVEIVDNQIRRIISEPPPEEDLWQVVKVWWYKIIQDRRPLYEDEWDYFIPLDN
jgi:hypothetical protein